MQWVTLHNIYAFISERCGLFIVAKHLSSFWLVGCGPNFHPALGMQLKVQLVHKHLSRLGMQLKDPVYKKCVHLRKFIVPSAVAALAVSLLQRQNDKKTE